MKNKNFKASLIDHSDEEALYNTFSCYLCVISLLVCIIIDQMEWNLITPICMLCICAVLYRIGYRIGQNSNSARSDRR